MRLPRAPGLARPRRGPGRGRAAVLAGAVVVLAVLAVAVAAAAGRPAPAAAPARPAAAVTLARATLAAETVPAAPAAPVPARDAGGRGGVAAGDGRLRAAGLRLLRQQRDHELVRRAGQVGGQPAAVPDRADRPVDPAAGLHRGGADLVVDRARDRRRLLRAAGADRRDHRDEPRDAADLLLGQGDRPPDRDRVRHREPVDGPDVQGDRPRQRPVRRVHRRRGEPAERRHLADDHAGQLGQLRRDLPDPARPGRGRPRPGARGGLRDPADGRGAAGRRRPGVPGPVRPAADRLGRPLVVAGADRRPGHPGRPGPGHDRRRAGVLLPRLAARRHQQHPRADPDHLVPAVHPDAHPVLDRAPRPVPVRPVPAAPRRPVRRHRRRLVPRRPAAAPRHAPQGRQDRQGSGSGKSGSSGSKPKGSTP